MLFCIFISLISYLLHETMWCLPFSCSCNLQVCGMLVSWLALLLTAIMELEFSNCQSSLLSSSLSSHLRCFVLLSLLVRILGFCLGLWFGSKPAEDGLEIMKSGHGSWSMTNLTYTGPCILLCKFLWLVRRWVDTLVFPVWEKWRKIFPGWCACVVFLLLVFGVRSFPVSHLVGLLIVSRVVPFPDLLINQSRIVDGEYWVYGDKSLFHIS